jgi:hypothetical protein
MQASSAPDHAMKRLLMLLTVLAISAKADPFEVSYSIHGLGKTIVIDAATANEARRTVEDLFPEAVVYNATRAAPCNCSPNGMFGSRKR